MGFKMYLFIGLIVLLDTTYGDDPPNTNTEIRTRGGGAPDGSLCHFPFLFQQVERTECIPISAGGLLWCSTIYDYDTDEPYDAFGFCDLGTLCSGTEGPSTTGGTANGAKCCFPFIYETVSFSECITKANRDDRPDGAWCAITDEHEPGGKWGYCPRDEPANTNTEITVVDGNVADGTLCYIPFLYKGEERTECITGDKPLNRSWCSTTYHHEAGGTFGYCEPEDSVVDPCGGSTGQFTVGGTANRASCCFPFIFDGEAKSECITTNGKSHGPWCGTTDNVDDDNLWGYCEEELPERCNGARGENTTDGNSDGEKCCFPFIYNSESKSQCVRSDDKPDGAWCATTDNFDLHNKWGYCDPTTEPAGSFATFKTYSSVTVMFAIVTSLIFM